MTEELYPDLDDPLLSTLPEDLDIVQARFLKVGERTGFRIVWPEETPGVREYNDIYVAREEDGYVLYSKPGAFYKRTTILETFKLKPRPQ